MKELSNEITSPLSIMEEMLSNIPDSKILSYLRITQSEINSINKQIQINSEDEDNLVISLLSKITNNEECNSILMKKEQTPEICLAAVHVNGCMLRFVENQTEEICLAAVTNTGYALRYVKEQTPKICLYAVLQNGNALPYVKEPTEEMCMIASRNMQKHIFVKDKK